MQQFHLLNKALRNIFTKLTHRACNSPRITADLMQTCPFIRVGQDRQGPHPYFTRRTEILRGGIMKVEPAGLGSSTSTSILPAPNEHRPVRDRNP